MDLLCGDVGYGKTEWPFGQPSKSSTGSKWRSSYPHDLAQQHGRTFAERFEGFP